MKEKHLCSRCGYVATACHVSSKLVYCKKCLEGYLQMRADQAMNVLAALERVLDAELAHYESKERR